MTTAAEFDTWIQGTRVASEQAREAPAALAAALLERLREGRETWDTSVLAVVHAWRGVESAAREGTAEAYPQTLALIAALRLQVEQRPYLRASLATIEGDLLWERYDLDLAAAAFVDAVDHLHALHLDLDTQRMYAMVRLAYALLHRGNKRDADKVFLDVLSYPWYLVTEAEAQALLRQSYIDAGLGLIECRRGDQAALADIHFVPAAHAELLPTLDAARQEAAAS